MRRRKTNPNSRVQLKHTQLQSSEFGQLSAPSPPLTPLSVLPPRSPSSPHHKSLTLFAMLRLSRTLLAYRTFAQLCTSTRLLSISHRNMTDLGLQEQKCVPCTSSLSPMPPSEAQEMLASLKGKWSLSPQPKTLLSSKAVHPEALHRTYKFKDYLTAQAFANKIGGLAESEGHHPAVMVEWGRVTVWWWSHAINGVSTQVLSEETE